jgi:hypothetical protein
MTIRKPVLLVAVALGAFALGTPPRSAQAQGTNPEAAASEETPPSPEVQIGQELPLGEVPEAALDAAEGALNAEPEKANVITLSDGKELYQITNISDTEVNTVYVTTAGEIVGQIVSEESMELMMIQPDYDVQPLDERQ